MNQKHNPNLELLLGNRLSKQRDPENNTIYYSEFKQIFSDNTFLNIGIKYVAEGTEYYKVGGTEHKVKEKHFLVSNKIPKVPGFVDSKNLVKGICIDINPKLIHDTIRVLNIREEFDIDDIISPESKTPYFFDHISIAKTSLLNKKLGQLENHLLAHEFELPFVNEEWFMEIAENLVCEQNPKWQALNRLKYLKHSTKKEVIRRLLIGKEYMDTCFMDSPKIKTIAEFASLSEFHFFRSFKDAFGLSPHQYILEKKLQYSLELLTVKKLQIAEVITILKFTDVHAFSNSFKKRFGIAPSRIGK